MNEQSPDRIAGYKIRRERTEGPYGMPLTLYRVEVYNGARKVYTTRTHISQERAIQNAADYVKRNFTGGTRLERITRGRR